MITLTTPALLFPAISLLLLAYTNRFLAIASLIRGLHSKYVEQPDEIIYIQIKNLRKRVILTRNMQALGISSLFLCVLTMFLIYAGEVKLAEYIFGISLILLMVSLGISIREIQISIQALNIQLSDMEGFNKTRKTI
ncbi:MAG: DUF2721 domain-containing protein [Candidatus Cyclobacteriaceae bacterium M3_2C_046]